MMAVEENATYLFWGVFIFNDCYPSKKFKTWNKLGGGP